MVAAVWSKIGKAVGGKVRINATGKTVSRGYATSLARSTEKMKAHKAANLADAKAKRAAATANRKARRNKPGTNSVLDTGEAKILTDRAAMINQLKRGRFTPSSAKRMRKKLRSYNKRGLKSIYRDTGIKFPKKYVENEATLLAELLRYVRKRTG